MNPYHHYILTGIIEDQDDLPSVKQEECSQFQYYEEQPQFITYENSNLCQIVASILNLNEEYVDWFARNKPIEFESMMLKAKRKFYRDKAKFRMQILQPHLYSAQQPQEPKKAKRGRKPIKCAEKQFVEDNSDHDKNDTNDKKQDFCLEFQRQKKLISKNWNRAVLQLAEKMIQFASKQKNSLLLMKKLKIKQQHSQVYQSFQIIMCGI